MLENLIQAAMQAADREPLHLAVWRHRHGGYGLGFWHGDSIHVVLDDVNRQAVSDAISAHVGTRPLVVRGVHCNGALIRFSDIEAFQAIAGDVPVDEDDDDIDDDMGIAGIKLPNL